MLSNALGILARMVLTFFVIVTLVFFATRLSGSPLDMVIGEGMSTEDRAIMIRYYELDRPVWEQYRAFLGAFLDGQFGLSFIERRPVAEMVAERLWPSAQLLISATLVTLLVAIPLGIIAAVWRKSWIGSALMTLAFLGYAVPNFVLAVFLILVFAFWLNWLPVVGNGTAAHFILPTLTLAAAMIAAIMRFTRNAMLDVLGQDYMRTARAKGLAESSVILKHGLRNAGITILSVVGLQVAALAASGSVVVESIFAWPGIGDLLVNAAIRRDYPVLQFAVLTVALAVIVINAAVDLAYSWADPRLRHSGGR
jgi:peptide/nickel transport system permease protein/oligopeptide transport system permease protein